jgi:hypothetical protein
MTPQERKLVSELFDRLAALEDAERDPDAERMITEGLRQAPNATYALVQTVLVQDEALKRADARIRALEDELGGEPEQPARPAGFLDNVRGALFGTPEPTRGSAMRAGSVPSVPREPDEGRPMAAGAQPMGAPYGQGGGGSFLGTAAATAAGMIGSSLLLGGIRSMTGHHGSAQAAVAPSIGAQRDLTTPWSNTQGGDLAREAGIDHIGHSPAQSDTATADNRNYGLLDESSDADDLDDSEDADMDFDDADDIDDDGDFGDDNGC